MDAEKLRLRDPEIEPTGGIIKQALGDDSYVAFEEFQNALGRFDIELEWTYYKHCSGSWLARGWYRWATPRGTNKEKVIFWLSAWDGFFNIAIWFLEKNRSEILGAEISEKTRQKIRDAKTLGKMKTFPVEFEIKNTEDFEDIYTLINYKKSLEAK